MEGIKNPDIRAVLNGATANFPDGMEVAWALRFPGNRFDDRVRGVDCMIKLCKYASKNNLKVFFYGNTEETLEALKKKLKSMFPELQIAGSILTKKPPLPTCQ